MLDFRPSYSAFKRSSLGFWVRKGLPDARAQRYMARVSGKQVFFFGTLGAWPQSEHARRCMAATYELLQANGNMVVDGFLCQGRVNPQVIAATQRKGGHPMTAERRARQIEAERHPDAADLAAARLHWQRCLQKCAAVTPSMQSDPYFATGILPMPEPIGNNSAL